MSTDEELFVAFAKRGDEAALQRLFSRYRKQLIYSFQNRVKDRDIIEEMVQRTFIKVVNNKNSFIIGAKFSAWIHTIADRTLKDLRKANGRRSRHEIPFTVLRDHKSPYAEWGADLYDEDRSDLLEDKRERKPPEAAILKEDGRRAMDAYNQLEEPLRSTVKLLVLDGLSSRTAAVDSDVTYRTLLYRLDRALDQVRPLVA